MNKPNLVKREIRQFERWLSEQMLGQWNQELYEKARRKLLALQTRDQPNFPAIMEQEAVKNIAEFDNAFAAYIASKRG